MVFDVIVVGGGPAGLAFARSLAGRGLSLALVERASRETLAQTPFDGREIALTHRSVAALKALGAWEHIAQEDIAPLRMARVLNGSSPFALSFDPAGSAQDRLGTLVPNHAIRRALFSAVDGQTGLTLLADEAVEAVHTHDAGASVELASGETLRARLVVGADSRFSFVREALGIPAQIHRPGRTMMCCRVSHEKDHEGIATEWFDYGQTVAILPLRGRTASVVLTLAAGEIDRICALDPAALGEELTRRLEGRLGALTPIGSPHAYPLAMTWSRHFAAPSAALIGDAAVGMHPVTAHGFNLGLQGAVRLGTLIREAVERRRDFAAPSLLRRYEADHRLAARPIYTGTNMLVGLFTNEHPTARAARAAALRAASRLPGLRKGVSRFLMQH